MKLIINIYIENKSQKQAESETAFTIISKHLKCFLNKTTHITACMTDLLTALTTTYNSNRGQKIFTTFEAFV